MMPPSSIAPPSSSPFPVPRSSFLVPRFSFPVPRSSFLVPRSSFLVPRSSFPVPRSPFPVPSSGFTLLEVVVAMAILMIFLVPILGAISQGLRNVESVKKRSVALRLAEDKMAELEALPVPMAEEVKKGEFGDMYPGYLWETEYIKTPDLQLMEAALPNLKGMEVHLRVYWEEAGAEKMIQLNSLLLE